MNWNEAKKSFILKEGEPSDILLLHGEEENTECAIEALTIGRGYLFPETNVGYAYISRFPHREIPSFKGWDFLPVYDLERLFESDELAMTPEEIINRALKNNCPLLIGSEVPLEEIEKKHPGLFSCAASIQTVHVTGAVGARFEELAEVTDLHDHEGRYAELYKPEYLELFPCERMDDLNKKQMAALDEMVDTVHRMTREMRPLFSRMGQFRNKYLGHSDCRNPGELPADLIAFMIVYVFWNRMNSTPVRNEEGFAKRGTLGRYIRALKEKDSVL